MPDHLRPVAIATHHVRLADYYGQEQSDVIAYLRKFETDEQQPRPYKLDSSDQKFDFAELFDWLNQDGRKVQWEAWVTDVMEGRPISEAAVAAMDDKRERSRLPRLPIRIVQLMRFKMSMAGFDALAGYVEGNGSLTRIDFCMNKAPGLLRPRPFASGINHSLLRDVSLSSIKFSPDTLIDFIDHLDAPCLRRLRLSSAFGDPDPSREDSIRASVSIARLVQSANTAPSWHNNSARQEGGRTPRLEHLSLGGTLLTPRGVRIIVASIIGSPTCPPNRMLFYLSLVGTTHWHEVDHDDDDGEPASKRAKQSKAPVTASQQRHGVEVLPNDPRAFSHVTDSNWRKLLNDHLWQNQLDKYSVNMASLRLLPIVRVLGCRSRTAAPPSADPTVPPAFNWAVLPTELKLEVLRALDDKRALSEAQFQRVIQWACDSSTIGYGTPDWRPPLSLRASSRNRSTTKKSSIPAPASTSQHGSLMPTHPWPWAFMIRSGASLPRDWDAEAYDESVKMRNFYRVHPGCNGVDDIAKEDDISYEAWPKSVRERWHGPADGAMLAFWDATHTDAPELGRGGRTM